MTKGEAILDLKHQYSVNDALKLEDGTWAIDFSLPSNGKTYRITASSPEYVADSVNQQIRLDLRTYDAEQPYREAVEALSKMCLEHTGSGSYAAVQVLLSAYNGNNYQVDLTDLCHLDESNFQHAMAIIQGRVFCSREPHSMIENGAKIFDALEEKWGNLNVRRRYETYYK
tara:strand:+ start:33372 stop:33884 length:513 start_codon:yes stop_codon:yes gene_type:complete